MRLAKVLAKVAVMAAALFAAFVAGVVANEAARRINETEKHGFHEDFESYMNDLIGTLPPEYRAAFKRMDNSRLHGN